MIVHILKSDSDPDFSWEELEKYLILLCVNRTELFGFEIAEA